MKAIKLTVQEITDMQPTTVMEVREHHTVVGGLELSGMLHMEEVPGLVKKLFGDDCVAWEGEADDGDGCVHVTVCAKV